MGRLVGRLLLFLTAAALPAVAGCGFAKRPYGRDPLLRDGGGIWGDAGMARGPDMNPFREPAAPHAPKPARSPGELARGAE